MKIYLSIHGLLFLFSCLENGKWEKTKLGFSMAIEIVEFDDDFYHEGL